MTLSDILLTAAILTSVPFALRATWRLWSLYFADASRSLLLFALSFGASVVTVTASWVGFLTVRRLFGFPPIDWSPPVTGLLAVLIFWVPSLFDYVVSRIGRRPDQPDNIGRGPR